MYDSMGNLRNERPKISHTDMKICKKGEYLCKIIKFCISLKFVCDNINHCYYSDDEDNCGKIIFLGLYSAVYFY